MHTIDAMCFSEMRESWCWDWEVHVWMYIYNREGETERERERELKAQRMGSCMGEEEDKRGDV